MVLPPLFAHRLGRAYGPDSSIPALERALVGADGVETDACLTADEQLVLLHDPLLSVGTNLQGSSHRGATAVTRRPARRHTAGDAGPRRHQGTRRPRARGADRPGAM